MGAALTLVGANRFADEYGRVMTDHLDDEN